MVKIGLIGAGWHALADHAPALRHCADLPEFRGRVELSAICDIAISKAQAAAQRFSFGCAYDSVEAMLPEVDAVLAIVPTAVQRDVLQLILKHHKPALTEKPIGRNLGEADQIAETVARHPHMVSLNRRFDPAVTIARQWMSDLSPPRTISGVMTRVNRQEPDFIWSTGVHLCDLIWFLAGPARIGSIDIRPAAGKVEERVDIAGDDWSVELHTGTHAPWRIRCVKSGDVEVDRTADPQSPDYERNGTLAETTAFVRAILNGEPMPAPTVADAMAGTRLASSLMMQDE